MKSKEDTHFTFKIALLRDTVDIQENWNEYIQLYEFGDMHAYANMTSQLPSGNCFPPKVNKAMKKLLRSFAIF